MLILQGKYIINYNQYRPSYIKGVIFYFSYYQYNIKCPELKTEVTRKDNDFYFLRDKLQKLQLYFSKIFNNSPHTEQI